jgi:hypothetical protein
LGAPPGTGAGAGAGDGPGVAMFGAPPALAAVGMWGGVGSMAWPF